MSKKQPDITATAIEFINGQHIMTMATTAGDSSWAAPLYYIFDGSEFYFFSKSSSRHISEALKANKVSASIHFQSSGWSDIKGIQMTGVVSSAGISNKSASAFNLYLNRFDFIGEIKKSAAIRDIGAVESVFKVKFYKFTPEDVYYLDNTIKFGFKKTIVI